MFECPNCKEKTIKKWSKFCLGPVRSVRCDSCGKKVSIPYKSLYFMAAYLIFIFAIPRLIEFNHYLFIAIIIVTVLVSYLLYKYVPLIVKFEEEDIGYKIQKRNNTLIGISYFIITFGALIILAVMS